MRILVVGAGALGGYFGGRLLQAGRDVTFLVRPRRAATLAAGGLKIKSPHGDLAIPNPPTILSDQIDRPFDLILLGCKAYDLSGAMDSLAAAVGAQTVIVPLLNGMRHLDALDERFGASHVLGGQCVIAATLDAEQTVVQLNERHTLSFGERDGGLTDRVRTVADALGSAGFDAPLSERIVAEMWEKWIFLATLAGSTSLMRAPLGDILAAPGGGDLIRGLFEECRAVADTAGYPPRTAFVDQARAALTARGSLLTASMLRDIDGGGPIEADHIIGDLLRRRGTDNPDRNAHSMLTLAYTHLKTYEARRSRMLSAAPRPATV